MRLGIEAPAVKYPFLKKSTIFRDSATNKNLSLAECEYLCADSAKDKFLLVAESRKIVDFFKK
jgi:cytidylate kinase